MNQITDYLQKQFSAMVELTEEIINVDSPSNDIAGIQKVADILSAKMREIGMQTRQRDSGKQGMALIGELPGEEGLRDSAWSHGYRFSKGNCRTTAI